MLVILGLLLLFFSSSNGLYSSNSDVVSLKASNFDQLVLESDAVWIVEFYAPWCGHCRALVPEYSKAATALKGVIKLGAVNCDEEQSLAARFKVRGFPTIKVFGADKKKPTDYTGERKAQAIVEGALNAARKKINAILTGKKYDSSTNTINNADVVELNDDNFESLVYRSNDYWLIEFYSPHCGYCLKLAPEWSQAATQLKGKAKLGAIDATANSIVPANYGIQGYPTIFYLEPGSTGKKDAKVYDGGRTSSDIVNWVLDKIHENAPPPDIVQLIDENNLKEQCSNNPLCVIAVLPHILDCQSDCRNNYITLLAKVADKYKRKMWGWLWVEAGAQTDLENTLNIGGFGYPAMAVLNSKKQKFSLLKGSFSEVGISEFLRDLSLGRGQTLDLKGGKLPKVIKTEPWDGQDQAVPEEEDVDLSDVVLDEIKEEL